MCFVCPSWLSFILYNPVRKLLTDRQKILEESGIKADSVVIEIGAGNGFFTEKIVTVARQVIAIELQEGMVRKLKKRIPPSPGVFEIVTGDASSVPAGENIADVCLLYYSFHEVGDKPGAVANICRMLKTGGAIAIYEPRLEVGEKDMKTTILMFEDSGCKLQLAGKGLFTRFARLTKVY